MSRVVETYRRLDTLQHRRSFRISATIIAFILCGTVFGWLLGTTYSLDSQRQGLRDVLGGINLTEGDPAAVQLANTGMVNANDRVYGHADLAARSNQIFASDGAIVGVEGLIDALLRNQRPALAPRWLIDQPGTTWLLGLATLIWLLLIVYMNLTIPFLLTLLGTGVPVGVGLALRASPDALAGWGWLRNLLPWFLANERVLIVVGGIGLLLFTYILLTRVLLTVFRTSHQPLAIAHTVVKEAGRQRISLVFIVLLLLVLPILPVSIDAEIPLRHQVQTFISRSLGVTFLLAACFTLFLSAATVAFEIRDRQIWQVMTKPVGRFQYLLGKWLGVMSLNAAILIVAGFSTFLYVQYLREQPANQEDRAQLNSAVLTARVGRTPDYEVLTDEQIRARVEQVLQRERGVSRADATIAEKNQKAREIREIFNQSLRSVPPMRGRTYTFSGLAAAKELQATLVLRYRFHILYDDDHETFPAAFEFNGDPATQMRRTYVPTMGHVVPVPARLIKDDGTLDLTIYNLYQPPEGQTTGSMNFEAGDLELLYKVGSFEGNFLRGITLLWVKLAFLSMLAICCATFLSFPVACLMSFTVFIAASISPFLTIALRDYQSEILSAEYVDWGNIGLVIRWVFQNVIQGVAKFLVFSLQSFGEYRPTQALVEGRWISWGSVAMGTLKIGVFWSGVSLIIGFLVIRARQLAIYSGQG